MWRPIHRGVFVTGTDTGVGKTRVAAALGRLLTERKVAVRPRKPAESGCPQEGKRLIPRDAHILRMAAGAREPLSTASPLHL